MNSLREHERLQKQYKVLTDLKLLSNSVYYSKSYKLCVNCIQAEDSLESGSIGRLELGYLEEERVRVLGKVDELKARITELEQQLQESKQEVSRSHKHFYIVKYTEGYTGSPFLIIVDKSRKQREVMRSGTENVRWSSRVCLCGLCENCSFWHVDLDRRRWKELCCRERDRLSWSKSRPRQRLSASCSANSANWRAPSRERKTR